MEDRDIIALYLQRIEDAITQTQLKYGGYCYRIAKNLLSRHEDAEECCADTYHAAWNQIPPDRPKTLPTYLGRITRNLAISRFRSIHAQKRDTGMEILLSELEDCVPSPDTPERIVEGKELSFFIDQWLQSLPPDDRVLFLRRYWYADAVNDLAAQSNRTPNQIAKRLQKLRLGLKAHLESKGVAV